MKDFFRALKISFTVISAVVGAGFITGKELTGFFGGGNIIFIGLSCALFFFFCYLLFWASKKAGDIKKFSLYLGIKSAPMDLAVFFSSFFLASAMLAAINVCFFEATGISFPLSSVILVLVSPFFCKKDLKVLERISAVLIPVFIAFAISLIWGRGEIKFNYPVDGASKNTAVLIIKSIIYPAMNVFIALPLILGAGKNERPRVCFLSSLFFAVFVCVLSVVVLSLVCGKVNFSGYDIPMLSATEGSALFYFCFFIAGAASFFSAMYALSPFVQKTFYRKDTPIKGIKGYLLSLLFSLSVFGFSLLGLNFIVDYFYPLIGVVGLFIFTRCAIKYFRDVRSNKAKKKEHTHR